MLEPRHLAGFLQEAFDLSWRGEARCPRDLDRHHSLQVGIKGAPDLAQASFTHQLVEPIAAQNLRRPPIAFFPAEQVYYLAGLLTHTLRRMAQAAKDRRNAGGVAGLPQHPQ